MLVRVMQVGEYEMVVTVGDDALEAGVRWPLGMVTISPAAGNSGAKASAAVPTAAQLDAQPKPEIHHIFRKPDRRPPAAISMLFATAAVAIPAAYLLIRLSQLGVNLKVIHHILEHSDCFC
jgi:oligosaccharyltransferase complex subunit delta (ribophorin II)